MGLTRYSKTRRLIANATLPCYTCMVLLTGHFLQEIIISTDQQYSPLYCSVLHDQYRTGSAFNLPMQSTIFHVQSSLQLAGECYWSYW